MEPELIGQRPTFTALPNWLRCKATPLEGWLLWCLQSHYPNIHPSLSLLAAETSMSRRSVCTVLAGMERKGWLVREQSTTESGRKTATRYCLTIWDPRWAVADSAGGALAQEAHHRARASQGCGVVQEVHGASAGGAHKEDQEKKRNPTALEPPLVPPAGGERRPPAVATDPCHDLGQGSDLGASHAWPPPMPDRDRDGFLINPLAPPPPMTAAAAPASPEPEPLPPVQPEPQAVLPEVIEPEVLQATQPQPQQPNPPWPLPEPAPDPEAEAPVNPKGQKRKGAGFQPGEGDVPAALLPVVRELLAFWASKGGKRTERAWAAQLGQLQRIQDDPAGGTEAVRTQLEAGAQAAVFGKAWMAVTHANWERYGKRVTPIIGSGFGRPTAMDTAARAMLLIRQREAKAKAEAEAMDRGLVLAEVA